MTSRHLSSTMATVWPTFDPEADFTPIAYQAERHKPLNSIYLMGKITLEGGSFMPLQNLVEFSPLVLDMAVMDNSRVLQL